MMNRLIILIMTFFLANISFASGMVVDFSDNVKELCTKNKSTLLAKKMFLTILKLEKQGKNPCENEDMKRLAHTCSGEELCSEIVTVYKDVIFKYEGRVLGQ